MKKSEIHSLQSLRLRKAQLAREIKMSENSIRYDLYLYTHPIEWTAEAVSNHNRNFSSENLTKMAYYSRDFFRIGRAIFRLIKVFRKLR